MATSTEGRQKYLNSLHLKGGSELSSVKNFMEMPAENYGNDQSIEFQWAMKAYKHAEVHFSLLVAVGDPTALKLTRKDDEIYQHFRESFPNLAINVIDEDHIKSPEQKALWRTFCDCYKGRVEDYNMASLMRIDSQRDVGETNTTIVPRVQFLAIEIARNREGHNNGLAAKYGQKEEEEQS